MHKLLSPARATSAIVGLGRLAYGSRYPAPTVQHLLTFTTLSFFPHSHHHHRHRHRHRPRTLTLLPTTALSFCPLLQNPNFLTGNFLFRGMEQFWSHSSVKKNKAMVENLQSYGVISSKKVVEVMGTIDRALFVPDGTPPYVDSPMAIGYNATISAPHMHATCLQLLEENLQPNMRALDIGSGTGYLTACFALMVGPQGRAVGVEHIPELASSSIENIKKSAAAPLLKEGSLSVHVGDGRLGWPEFAPYDAIHVGAAAPEIPQPLIDQLKPGGRMVIPVGNIFQDLKVVDKNLDGSISVRTETSVRYVPLTSKDAQLRGS
ncbi:PREDICTED:-L-isoaspartate [Prunus dulcis]|uniref:Protein-L-isoaspartate O-methyltransferase n=1 Tax=Prunus dulcis TaxID=3755 RepID=A0A5E4FJP1_PRUDU|nr:protein-L-isoaspartate O-methyltransferase 1-like [Prunus dulcis]VVA25858.1 PREDICTED:-L-isoaspartate [Prunus dulcis]